MAIAEVENGRFINVFKEGRNKQRRIDMTTLLSGPPAKRMAMKYNIPVDKVRELIDERGNEYAEGVIRRLVKLRNFQNRLLESERPTNNKKEWSERYPTRYCPT